MSEPRELPWTENTSVTTTVRRLMHGTFLGRSATAWDDSGAQWDGPTEVVATQVTETIEGELDGWYPDLGTVRMSSGERVTTEATIRIDHPPVFVKQDPPGVQTEVGDVHPEH